MGGRGRGRGTGLSFSTESLGFNRGDALPSGMLAPPPMFPPLNNPPVKLVEDNEQEYINAIWKEYKSSLRASQFYLGGPNDPLPSLDLDWERFPAELRPGNTRKKKISADKSIKSKKNKVDITRKLDELGKREMKNEEDSEEEADGDKKPSDDEEERKSDKESGDDEPDEEMDGGTDYASNYFDNGEGYGDDEDDNLDEGGIY